MHFQAVTLKKEQMLRLVHTLNELAEEPKRMPRAWLERSVRTALAVAESGASTSLRGVQQRRA